MHTEALEYFIKVYEKKSITAAAKDLFITPQGISKTIKQLELELETELFYRGSRGMEATESGELLHARARHILYLMEDIKKEISILSGQNGMLNVVVTYSTTLVYPVDKLYSFSALHPDIQIKITELPDEYSVDKEFEEEIDAALIMGDGEVADYEFDLIKHGEAVIVVSNSHPLAVNDEISLVELENESMVLKSVEKGREHSLMVKCLELGFTPNIIHEFGSILTAHRLCEVSGYVAVSVDFVEEAINNDHLKIIRLKEKIPQNIYLITRRRGVQTKVVSLFQSFVKDFIKENN
ncbi:LysR family transcriptional regulator [Radiobacillus sp. PE A8.2]|uniref:LysR family transcriptional regulator n=1 Tax=Radiobacillus sp. PE A8.2 TaxID=3380349 RepID=UPI003890EB8C